MNRLRDGLRDGRVVDLAREVARRASEHKLGIMAAALAFYALLSVFPFLIFVVAVVSRFPLADEVAELEAMLARVLPEEVARLIGDHLHSLLEGRGGSLVGIGFVTALWAATRAMRGLMACLNTAAGKPDGPAARTPAVALLLTIASGGVIVVALVLLALGDVAAELLSRARLVGHYAASAIAALRWPVFGGALVVAIDSLYYFGPTPEARPRWRWLTPGALLAVTLWVLGSFGLRLYVVEFGRTNAIYGSLGGVAVAMVYFYMSAWVLLLGGELNAAWEARRAGR